MASFEAPRVGDTVHYVSRGSADLQYPSTCRAAIVTDAKVSPLNSGIVSATVLSPQGMHMEPMLVWASPGDENGLNPGTWHFREECDQ